MKRDNNILLFIILIVAVILRFWNFPNIPFMADELGALARTHFNSFNDLINKGVLTDTHPAGIQVFLYYWTKLFGYSEMAVKFPFIITGIISIYFIYKIAAYWFNNTVGLIISSFMAVLQYMVMYSQIARPYIGGMFFSILMVWCWTNYLFNSNPKKTKWLIGYIVFSSLCSYDHHFALLFAATVGITGIFFLKKNTYKGYLIAGLSIFVLYIPHLKVFFYQLNMGSVGEWLGKPKPDWLFTYLKYIFHFSNWMYILVILLIILSIIFRNKKQGVQKFRIIALSWFVIQFIIGYYYSIKANPILQYSTLMFVFPFFLMFMFSFFGELKKLIVIPLVLLILLTGTLTLVFERNHFTVFYKQPFEKMVTNTYKILDSIGNPEKVTIELFLPPGFKEIYFKKYNRTFNYTYFDQYENVQDAKAFRTFVNNQKSDYFVTGNLPLEYILIIKEKYPYIFEKDECFTYSGYCFSKIKPKNEITETIVITNKSFEKNNCITYSDTSVKYFFQGKTALSIDSTKEYTHSLKLKIKDVCSPFKFSIVNIAVDMSSLDTAANALLVFDLRQGDKSINWNASELKKYNNNSLTNTVFLSQIISYQNILDYPNAELNIYIWNKTKSFIKLNNFKFEIIRANPNIYKLFEK